MFGSTNELLSRRRDLFPTVAVVATECSVQTTDNVQSVIQSSTEEGAPVMRTWRDIWAKRFFRLSGLSA
jgi:hypothetical protein